MNERVSSIYCFSNYVFGKNAGSNGRSRVPTPIGSDQRTDTPGSHASFPDQGPHSPSPLGDVHPGPLSSDEHPETHRNESDHGSDTASPDPNNLLQVSWKERKKYLDNILVFLWWQ
jgi:hypothetical protein